jgi:SAM-dependent methyltransferase
MTNSSSLLSLDQIDLIIDQVKAFTMVPAQPLRFTIEKAVELAAVGPFGVFVECGVWRGGSSMAMLLAQRAAFGKVLRPVYLFDSFEGLPPVTARDGPQARAWQANKDSPTYRDNCRAELDAVLAAFSDKGFGLGDFFVFKGWFQDTLPGLRDELAGKPVAMLRLDADWYDSTMLCFEYLEPLISDGGIVIIDDYYTWEGCARATHDYLSRHDLPYRINCIHGMTGAWLTKQGKSVLLAESTNKTERINVDQPIQNMKCFMLGISLVKNEEDIIEAFVRHNLRFLDAILFLENGSTDGTYQILLALQQEGLPIVIFQNPEKGYFQSKKLTKLLRAAAASFFPDFVFPLDADEFIKCSSRNVFVDALKNVPHAGFCRISEETYIITPAEALQLQDVTPKLLKCRRKNEIGNFSKAIIRLDGAWLTKLKIEQGNHNVSRIDGGAVTSLDIPTIRLAHFPVRSSRQFETKAVLGWLGYLQEDPDADKKYKDFAWRNGFYQIAYHGSISAENLANLSLTYAPGTKATNWDTDIVYDPMDFEYVCKYDAFKAKSSLATIVRSLASEYVVPGDKFPVELEAEISRKKAEFREKWSEGVPNSQTAFDAKWHYENFYFDHPPFSFLAGIFRPESVLDVGCGLGAYLKLFESQTKAQIFGIDGIPQRYTLLDADQYMQHDLAKPFDLKKSFSFVVCVEVVEHLEESAAQELLKCLSMHSNQFILFSAAEIGQPGKAHINCQSIDYWLDLWSSLGWEPDGFVSLSFRALGTLPWMRRNPVLLRRRHAKDVFNVRTRSIRDIGRKTFNWSNLHVPGIVRYPLSEQLGDQLYEEDAPKVGQDQIIQATTSKLKMKEQEAMRLAETVADQERQIASLRKGMGEVEDKYFAIRSSLYWRIMSPFRLVLDRHPRMRVALRRTFKVLLDIYRRRRTSGHI